MKNQILVGVVLVAGLFTSACAEKSFDKKSSGDSSSAVSSAIPVQNQIPANLLTGVSNTAGGLPDPAAQPRQPVDKISELIRILHRDIFAGTQYDHAQFDPSAVVNHYRQAYNASNGNGCKRVAYVFLANHPARAQALAGNDSALKEFIVAHYRGLVPKHFTASTYATNSANVYNWYKQNYLTMDEMAQIFLDDAEFIARCRAAGMGL